MPAHKAPVDSWQMSPYSPENVHRLARLHVLAHFAQTGYHLRVNEHSDTWDAVLTDLPGPAIQTAASDWLQNPVGEAITILEKYMDDRYINYPVSGQVALLEEGFWFNTTWASNAGSWLGQDAFLKALFKIEQTLVNEYRIQDFNFPPVLEYRGVQTCRVCGDSSMHDIVFSFKGWKWPYNLKHYVETHNHKPSDAFIHFIRRLDGKRLIKTDLAVINKREGTHDS